MSKKKAKEQLQLPSPPVETQQQKQARVNEANKKLHALLKEYRVGLNVSHLDISSGRILPRIDLVSLD